MSDAQYIGIYLVLILTMLILEIGMLTICDRLKTIVRLLEKILKERREENAAD